MGKVAPKVKQNPVQDNLLRRAKTAVTSGTSTRRMFGKDDPKSAVTNVRQKSDNSNKPPYDWAKDKDLRK